MNGQIQMNSYFPPLGKILFPKTGLWQNASLFTPDFNLKNSILKESVKIIFDERYVPHIYAQNTHDALFAQGYIEARDRLFQMEVQSKSAAGRLSELFGSQTIAIDVSSREQGFEKAAQKAVDIWMLDDQIDLVHAYVAGVNQYISNLNSRTIPFEYKLLDVKPKPWTALDMVLVKKSMDRMLCGKSRDIEHSNLLSVLGDTLYHQLFQERNPYDQAIIPDDMDFDFEVNYDQFNEALNIIDSFPDQLKEDQIKGLGSNNWAVHGSRTTTGKPILANDPHLALTLPSIWYEVCMYTPEFESRGVSIPGLPGILVGFNKHIAWGTTNSAHDVKDYYLLKYIDREKGVYEIDGQHKTLTKRTEVIKVKSAKDTTINVFYSDWGPINYISKDGEKDMSVSWLPNQIVDREEYRSFIDILSAKSYDDFLEGMDHFSFPAQNFIAASKDGDIGIRVTGTLIQKQKNDGRFVKDGSFSVSGTNQIIPKSQLPQARNPESGYLASANQWSTNENYPYYYNTAYFENYRGRRINELLDTGEKLDLETIRSFQHDTYNIKASEVLPYFLNVIEGLELDTLQSAYMKELSSWNFKYEPDLKAPVIFDAWWRSYYSVVYDEIKTIRDRMPVMFPNEWVTVDLTTNDPNHDIFDINATTKKETADDIIIQTFMELTANKDHLVSLSDYKNYSIPHIARIGGLNSKKLKLGGSGNVLNAISNRAAPSWRMVVALGEEPEAYGVFPGGQSGNPNSPFYKDNIDKWAQGQYHELKLMKQADITNPTLSITLNSN